MQDRESFEYLMGLHGAPTLLGLKPASLISFRKSKFWDFDELLASYMVCFSCKGISVCRLAEGEDCVLLLFYRRHALAKMLDAGKRRELLETYGYDGSASVEELLEELKLRTERRMSFPHEIGLFLGYPPEDVQGFIEHRGQDFSYSGYWKVYANEAETRKLFDLYAACTHGFCQKLKEGARFSEMLIAG